MAYTPDTMTAPLPEITDQEDVEKFVNLFYNKVMCDDLLKPIFVDVASVDWDTHLPTMYSFWSSMLLGTQSYKGAPFPVHAALKNHITPAHFIRWLALFEQTIDSLFCGELAETAKQRARNIAIIFQSKMEISA